MTRRDRRFPISLPLVKDIWLSLWAHTRGVSKTRMAEAIVIDRVSARCNRDEVIKDLTQEAAVLGMTLDDLLKEVLSDYSEVIDVNNVDWSALMNTEFPLDSSDSESGDDN